MFEVKNKSNRLPAAVAQCVERLKNIKNSQYVHSSPRRTLFRHLRASFFYDVQMVALSLLSDGSADRCAGNKKGRTSGFLLKQ
jgi:hypothetical protein